VHLQPAPVIVNKAQLPEPIHKEADSGASRTYHLRERLLTDLGDHSFWCALLRK
jgi:hypothetical protein